MGLSEEMFYIGMAELGFNANQKVGRGVRT